MRLQSIAELYTLPPQKQMQKCASAFLWFSLAGSYGRRCGVRVHGQIQADVFPDAQPLVWRSSLLGVALKGGRMEAEHFGGPRVPPLPCGTEGIAVGTRIGEFYVGV